MVGDLAAGRMRVANGLERLFAQPTVRSPANGVPFERSHTILVIYFTLSLLIMWQADSALGLWMREFPRELRGAARFITDLGEGDEILVTTGVLLILAAFIPPKGLRRRIAVGANAVTATAAFIFMAVAGGGLAAWLLKNIIGRARPGTLDIPAHLHFQPFTFDSDFAAFPSGHSATAGAMAMSLALSFPRLRSVFIPVGVLICLSRQLVGAHWPSDTLMGWAVGVSFTLWLAHTFARRRLMFFYDGDGCLRRKEGRRVLRALWDALQGKCATARLS